MPSKKLTVKEAKLVKGIAMGKTKQAAALAAGYGNTPAAASSTASDILKKPKVQEALQAELARQGISIADIVAPVVKGLKATKVEIHGKGEEAFAEVVEDIDLQMRAHDRAIKIIGGNQIEAGSVTNNFIQVVNEQKNQYGI